MKKLFFLLCALYSQASLAEDGSWARGLGMSSCGEFYKASEEQKLRYYHWVGGYISGFNASTYMLNPSGNSMVSSKSDMGAIEGWLKNHCKEHPLELFSIASLKLHIELAKNNQ